jgi:hypothetical protein
MIEPAKIFILGTIFVMRELKGTDPARQTPERAPV